MCDVRVLRGIINCRAINAGRAAIAEGIPHSLTPLIFIDRLAYVECLTDTAHAAARFAGPTGAREVVQPNTAMHLCQVPADRHD